MQDTPAARRWRRLLERQAASGLRDKAFARLHNVNPSTLAWWRSRLRRLDAEAKQLPAAQPMFTEVVVAQPAAPTAPLVLALDRFRARLVVDRRTDLDLLHRVLEVVG